MEEMKCDGTQRRYTFIKYLGITVIALLMLVSIVDAAPFAYITNLNSNTVSVIDTATNTVTATVTVGYGPQGIAATQDGNKVYVTNSGYGVEHPDSSVSVIDTATNTVIKTVAVGHEPIRIAATPDGGKVYVSNTGDHTVSVIDTATNTIIKTVNVGGYTGGIAVTPDGKRVYVANYYDHGTVSIIDTATDTVTATVKVKLGPYEVAITPDGTKVYVTHPSNAVSVIDTATNTVINTLMLPGPIGSYGVGGSYGVAVTPDGKKVYVANSGEYPDFIDTVSVIDTKTDSVTAIVIVGSRPQGIAVTPDGTSVFVTNPHSNDVSVIDTATNRVTATVPVGPFPYGVAFTPLRKLTFPVANFSSNITEDYAPLIVQFTDLSENATGVKWDFDNDRVIDSTERNPVYIYANSGTYTVNLTATNVNGTDSKLATITVLEQPILPVANFISNVTEGYIPLSVQFTDLSTNATKWNWDFGDGATSIEQNPKYTYSTVGTYTVNLTASSENGTSSKTATIIVLPAPLKTPIITWNNPADITAGTALGSEQLNAIATDPNTGNSVTGTFIYNPEEGTVLDAGTHTLYVDFTPSDSATYNTASADIQINVLEQQVVSAPIIKSIIVPLEPVPINTSIIAIADVTYLGDFSILIAEWNWGDGSTSESQGSSNFETSHVYNSPGIYTVNLKITDTEGRSETKEASNYIVVYDPQGGFVTGGGWINSPAGAYVPDNTLAGKATFGFVSKYEKGATVPTGKTEFQFKVANLNFHSVNYDWLVVAGSQAKYKGTGTINGEGNYGFMLSAVDGSIDKFRIKIWDKESGNTIYDNEIGTGEDAEPSTAIGGGSIIVHKEK